MAQLHITEAELARDLHAVLEKVRSGVEVVVDPDNQDSDNQPVVIKAPAPPGRLLSECIALAEAHGSTATLDQDFAKDLEEIILLRQEPLNPRWD
jgi:hypothetical protein